MTNTLGSNAGAFRLDPRALPLRRGADPASASSPDGAVCQAIAESCADLLLAVDRDARVVYGNAAARRALAAGDRAAALPNLLAITHPEDVAALFEAIQAARQGRPRDGAELVRLRQQDGAWRAYSGRWAYVDQPPLRGCAAVTLRDVTREMEERNTDRLLRALVERLDRGVCILDAAPRHGTPRTLFANRAFITQRELLGEAMPDGASPPPSDEPPCGPAASVDVRTALDRQGIPRAIEEERRRLPARGWMRGGIALLERDVTAERDTSALLRRAAERLGCVVWHGTVADTGGDVDWNVEALDPEAAARILPVEAAPGQPWFAAFRRSRLPDDAARMDRELVEAARACGEADCEYRGLRRDGVLRHWRDEVTFEPDGPRRWKVTGISRDVTDEVV
jgi:PAS domain-containing protein